MEHVVVTGGAGFIGSHLVERLLAAGWRVTVVDNFDPFYPEALKRRNLAACVGNPAFTLLEADIRDLDAIRAQCAGADVICHLAAKAGIRPSLLHPLAYQEVNVCGTQQMLELARQWKVRKFIFASSSSVYGLNPNVPWREDDCALQPISPYACSKVSGEMLAHTYCHLYGLPTVALRLFTVYGPRQRPDLVIHKYVHHILHGECIPVYGDGSTRRDYTYVADVVAGMLAAIDYDMTPFATFNLGNNATTSLHELIVLLEAATGETARREAFPDQPGDLPLTCADIERAQLLLGYCPTMSMQGGLERFVAWYREVMMSPRDKTLSST